MFDAILFSNYQVTRRAPPSSWWRGGWCPPWLPPRTWSWPPGGWPAPPRYRYRYVDIVSRYIYVSLTSIPRSSSVCCLSVIFCLLEAESWTNQRSALWLLSTNHSSPSACRRLGRGRACVSADRRCRSERILARRLQQEPREVRLLLGLMDGWVDGCHSFGFDIYLTWRMQ